MEPVTDVSVTQKDACHEQPLTLPQARERMIDLLREAESNAWEIGNLLNTIENQGLARRAGYGKTRSWLAAEVPGAEGKTTTLYRYATVAARYSKGHVKLWGVSKLELLIAHDKDVGHSNSEDPANREVRLAQPDGSTVTKQFNECSYRDLLLSTRHRRKSQGTGQKGPAVQEGEVRSLGKSSRTNPPASPKTEEHSLKVAFALMALGIVLTVISQFLPLDFLGGWILLGAVGCFLGGVGMVIRHWHDFQERFIKAVKEGRAFEFLAEHLDKARHGVEKVAMAIRWKVKPAKTPTSSTGETPPTEKKAA